jgi:GMP synthase (glutamine-hydrolysing)
LAVRCICSSVAGPAVTRKEIEDIAARQSFQSYVLELRTVGVQGDSRTYHPLVVLAGEGALDRFAEAASSITSTVPETSRVVALISTATEATAPLSPAVLAATMSAERLETLREADAIVDRTMEEANLNATVWQFPVVLLPVTFGEGETVALRPVKSVDGMTANHAELPMAVVREIACRLLRLDGVGAVVYDVSDKPPATIEWE